MHFSVLLLHLDPAKQCPGPTTLLEVLPGLLSGRTIRSCRLFAQLNHSFIWHASWHKILADDLQLRDDDELGLPRFVQVRSLDVSVLPSICVWRGEGTEMQEEKPAQRKASSSKKRRRKGGSKATGRGRGSKRRRKAVAVAGSDQEDGEGEAEAAEAMVAEGSGSECSLPAALDDVVDEAAEQATAGPLDAAQLDESQLLAGVSDLLPALPATGAAGAPGVAEDRKGKGKGSKGERARSSKEGKARIKVVSEDIFQVHLDGACLGSLRFNPRFSTMTAHCQRHDNCRKQRTVLAGARSGQGRPIGYLTSWLLCARDHDEAATHVHQSDASLSHEVRAAARARFMALPDAARFAAHERDLNRGESEEPLIFR